MPKLINQFFAIVKDNPLLIIVGVIVVLMLVLISFPIAQEKIFLAPQGEMDRFYFGGPRVLGQAFVPPPGLAEIIIPLGTAPDMKEPLILHLRESWYGPDLRTSTIYAITEQYVKFKFPLIVNPPAHILWVLEAPHAPAKSYWVYREKDETVKSGQAYVNEQKIIGGYGYSLVKRLPLAVLWFGQHPIEGYWHPSQVLPWEKYSLLIGVVVSGVVLVFRRRLRQSVGSEQRLVTILIGIGILLHLPMVMHTPLINDEGAYIQDVLQAKPDFLPLREYLTKGPLYLIILKAWQLVAPHSVLGWRLLPVISWAVATGIFWQLLRQLAAPRGVRVLGVALMTLSPAAIALTTPLLLQTTSTAVMLASVLAIAYGAKQSARRWIIIGALVLTAAFFVRVSSLVGGFVGIVLIAFFAKRKISFIGWYLGTGVLSFLVVMSLLVALLGWRQALVAANAEAFIISEQRSELQAQSNDREPLIRKLTIESRILWRGASPLLAGVCILPLAFIHRRRFIISIAIAVAWTAVLYQVYWHLADTGYLLPETLSMVRLLLLCLVFGGALAMLVLRFTEEQSLSATKIPWRSLVPFILWLSILAYLYLQWGRFRQSYLVEFIPPLAALSSWGGMYFINSTQKITPSFLRTSIQAISLFLVSSLYLMGWVLHWHYPHTGTISQVALRTFSQAVTRFVPPGQEIFTAQPNITAFSDRPILFGNTHPGWYREVRFGTIPASLRDLFFVPPEQVTAYLHNEAAFVALDVRTYEIYFDGYPERQQLLRELFVPVVSVDNDAGGGTLELYQRRPR